MAKPPKSAAPASSSPIKRESAGSALAQVVIGALVVGGALFWYRGHSVEKERVNKLAVLAKEAAAGDDAPALLAAKKLFLQIGDDATLMKDDGITAAMAELSAQLYQAYGVVDEKPTAEKFLTEARARDIRKAERYAAEAYLQIAAGQPSAAQATVTALTDKGVRHGKLMHALAVAHLAQGQARLAQATAEEGMKIASQLVRLPIVHGDALLEQGNTPAAKMSYKKALTLNGNHVRARTAMALTEAISREGKPALLLRQMDSLLDELSKAFDGKPPPRDGAFIRYAKGEVMLVDNDPKSALKMADEAVAADPTLSAAVALKARAEAKLGRLDDARKSFQKALAMSPMSVPLGRAAAEAFARAGKPAEGLTYMEKVRDANPENGLAFVYLAMAQARAGKGPEAVKSAGVAIEKLGNAHDLALLARGKAHAADNKLEKAREDLREAIQNHGNPLWPEVYYEMALVFIAEKDGEEASKLLKNAIEQWERGAGSIEDIADAYESLAKAYQLQGKKKAGDAKQAADKATSLRKGKA